MLSVQVEEVTLESGISYGLLAIHCRQFSRVVFYQVLNMLSSTQKIWEWQRK